MKVKLKTPFQETQRLNPDHFYLQLVNLRWVFFVGFQF